MLSWQAVFSAALMLAGGVVFGRGHHMLHIHDVFTSGVSNAAVDFSTACLVQARERVERGADGSRDVYCTVEVALLEGALGFHRTESNLACTDYLGMMWAGQWRDSCFVKGHGPVPFVPRRVFDYWWSVDLGRWLRMKRVGMAFMVLGAFLCVCSVLQNHRKLSLRPGGRGSRDHDRNAHQRARRAAAAAAAAAAAGDAFAADERKPSSWWQRHCCCCCGGSGPASSSRPVVIELSADGAADVDGLPPPPSFDEAMAAPVAYEGAVTVSLEDDGDSVLPPYKRVLRAADADLPSYTDEVATELAPTDAQDAVASDDTPSQDGANEPEVGSTADGDTGSALDDNSDETMSVPVPATRAAPLVESAPTLAAAMAAATREEDAGTARARGVAVDLGVADGSGREEEGNHLAPRSDEEDASSV